MKLIPNRLLIYDVEVYQYDWIAIFKDYETKEFFVFHNDPWAIAEFISEDAVYVGFNSKHYDQYIIKGMCGDLTPVEIKWLNDWIIKEDRQGWECPLLDGLYLRFNNVDIRDDMQKSLSLKAAEGHMGLSVQETNVPFDIDRPLTAAELEEVIRYCKHDVNATEALMELRTEYLKSKIQVGLLAGIPATKAMGMTNAKLTAALLGATPHEYTDEREYQYPPNLTREFIPQEVFDYFDRMHDPSIPDKVLFKSKLRFRIGDCPCVIGFGGIHGAIPNYIEEAKGTRVIRNYDVASLYPSLMIKCGYTSRNIPSAQKFEEVYHTRLAAKKSGDKATANALKLVLNTTYGAMLNQYNDLYDPLMGRSVCVSGQLFLTELACRYISTLKSVKLIQINTDGIMVSLEEEELPALLAINDGWQERTGFLLEEDEIEKIVQKDVNNYIEIKKGGSVKTKGGYLVRGIAPAGQFNMNNNAVIVATAIREYFVSGTPVEETILACEDVSQFQMIAKAGAKYKEAYHLVEGERQEVQKVNRVYATRDERYGKLYKVKTEDESEAKIEMLPEHCIIDNDNQITIGEIDKIFYIQMALKRINDFLGIKPEKKGRKKKMPAAKKPEFANIFQKLLAARAQFLAAGAKKTGKNMHIKFKYFELEDIVPVATPIFQEVGLLPLVTFSEEAAVMTMVDVDDPDQKVVFTSPMRTIDIAKNPAMNELQALGASQTYQRRYLYMMALDIVEADEIDSRSGDVPVTPAPAPKAPVSQETRAQVKADLTSGNATELQLNGLKEVLKKWREADPTKEEAINQIAIQTQGFSVISKADCEALILKINGFLEAAG